MVWTATDVPNESGTWKRLDLAGLEPSDHSAIPYVLVANHFKSSSPDCENFIHNPLRFLIEGQTAAVSSEDALFQLGLDWDWRVTTLVLNHHQTLSATHLHAMVALNQAERVAGITMVKKP
jgi:hypothetical protein